METIRRYRKKYRESGVVVVNVLAEELVIVYCSRVFCVMTDSQRSELTERGLRTIFCRQMTEPDELPTLYRSIYSGKEFSREVDVIQKNGPPVQCRVDGFPICEHSLGTRLFLLRFLPIYQDIHYTEKKPLNRFVSRSTKEDMQEHENVPLTTQAVMTSPSEPRPITPTISRGHRKTSHVSTCTVLEKRGADDHLPDVDLLGRHGERMSMFNIVGDIALKGSLSEKVTPLRRNCTSVKSFAAALGKEPQHHPPENKKDVVVQVMTLESDFMADYKSEVVLTHPLTVLHYSLGKIIWDWIILILVLYTAVMTPFMSSFLLTQERKANETWSISTDPLIAVDYFVDVMFVIDIFINFRTTYLESDDRIVTDPMKIAQKYVKGWFAIDLVSAIPFELIIMLSNTKPTTSLMGLLKTARLLRLVRVARKADLYSEYGLAVLLLMMLGFTLVAHWMACIWYAIGFYERGRLKMPGWLETLSNQVKKPYVAGDKFSGPDVTTAYVTALYFTLSSLTSVGFGNVSANTNAEKVFTIVIMILGALMHAVIFGNVTAIIQRLYSNRAHYHAVRRRLGEFIQFFKIPRHLKRRLENYAQANYTYTNGIDVNKILKSLPDSLRSDVSMYLCRRVFSSHPSFQSLSVGSLRALSTRCVTIHCVPGDQIVIKGDVIKALYFIQRGMVEVNDGQRLIAILDHNDSFGDNIIALWNTGSPGRSRCTVQVVHISELLVIPRQDLVDLLNTYPDICKLIQKGFGLTVDLREDSSAQGDRVSCLPLEVSVVADSTSSSVPNAFEKLLCSTQESGPQSKMDSEISSLRRRLDSMENSILHRLDQALNLNASTAVVGTQ